ncbi:FecR family protein [Maribacter dokdonensis]|uniref:FecR family protein n=1 Tax=Maribacter dokdonensis TaxID=320912 RepID=A0A1H4UVX0_9FLAO|nr:FecR domain-containing protein [Maribacter dokdonensis]SEC73022.1 FecR family protein [Maribacter dokdonensis]
MKYDYYKIEDFVADEYFQKWVLNTDDMCDNFWQNWLKDSPGKLEDIEKARNFIMLLNVEENQLAEQDFNAMWRNIIERRDVSKSQLIRSRKTKPFSYARVAAVFIGLMVSAMAVYYTTVDFTEPVEVFNQITLELEDGTIKYLNEEKSEMVTNAQGKKIVEQRQNTLHYANADTLFQELKYNQLTVPYGKKFQLELSDGSHVFLNSGSKLRYPVHFLSDTPRNVYLDGEAYFEVEKDKSRPFTVVTHDMDTRVLGTEFNVSSYGNENNTSTVLVEGSVIVYSSGDEDMEEAIKIVPGERAVFQDDAIDVATVNVEKYIAWKDNKLLFEDDRFYLILKELERNFNVEIENRYGDLENKKFTGSFDKESLDQILRVCSEHTPFQYSWSNGKIIITKNQELSK